MEPERASQSAALQDLSTYLPMDRRQALAAGADLPDRANGTALFADISGFTPLTEALTEAFGPRRGAEELTRQLNQVYDALIAEVLRFHGSVIDYSGDAVTCWFDDLYGLAPLRATACALAMQEAMRPFASITLPDARPPGRAANGDEGAGVVSLAVKIAVATGPARRFSVGCPDIQLLDALAGATLERMAQGEHMARKGEVVVDGATASALGDQAIIMGWRMSKNTPPGQVPESFAVVRALREQPEPSPWPALAPGALSEERVRPWLLPAVYERLADGLGEFLTELRPVAALFLRFEGIDYDGDDQAEARLDAYVCWVQRVLARYAGTLLQLGIGDKGSYLYAVFGLPVAHEDDARRAVSVALDLRAPPPELDFVRPPQIGLSLGTMRTGAYGSRTRRAYGALGNEVNLAARLMQYAEPGEIVASQRVYQAAAEEFAWEAVPAVQVKGKSAPVDVWRLLGRAQAAAPAAAYSGELIGRDAELAALVEFLGPILAGEFAGLAYLFGEPGMGKSRLVHELRQRLDPLPGQGSAVPGAGGQTIHWFTCPAEGILRQSLHPFKSFLHKYFEQSTHNSEEMNRQCFEHTLGALLRDLRAPKANGRPAEVRESAAQELERTRWNLAAMVDLGEADSPYQRMDPKERFDNTLLAFKALIRGESLRRPVVLCVEDAHWLDGDSLELLRVLVRGENDLPFGVLLTSRYDDDGRRWALETGPDVPQRVVELQTLPGGGVRALAAQVAGGELADRLAAYLAEKTGGNPFFIEQLTLDLRERGLLRAEENPAGRPRYDLADGQAMEELPVGINAVLVARLDRLAAQVKAVVQTAAVLGQEFEVRVLSQVLRADSDVETKVRQAEAQAIWLRLSEIRYLFKHALLRDAAYDMQLQERLAELHRLAGESIEALYAGELPPHAADLVYHFGRAGDPERELRYARLAAEHAAEQYANAEAVTYLTRALALTPAADSAARYDLLLMRENALNLQGARQAQREDLETLGQLAEQLDEEQRKAEVALRWANYYEGISNYPAALLAAQHAVRAAQAAGAVESLAAGHLRWGVALWRQADYTAARAHLEQALELARSADLPRLEADALRHLGNVAYPQGDYARAKAYGEQARRLRRQVGRGLDESSTMANLGNVAGYIEDYGSARARLEQDLALLRQVGNRRGESGTLSNLGYVCIYQGDFPGAQAYLEQALALKREIGDRRGEATALTYLGLLAVQRDDYEAAHAFGQQALGLTDGLGARSAKGYALTCLGHALFGLGRLAEAAEVYQQAVDLRHELKEHHLAMESLAGLARVFLVQGDLAVARAQVEEILEALEAGSLDRTNEPIRVYLTCFQVLEEAKDPRAQDVLEIGYELLQERAAKFDDEAQRRAFLENAPAHRVFLSIWDARQRGAG